MNLKKVMIYTLLTDAVMMTLYLQSSKAGGSFIESIKAI